MTDKQRACILSDMTILVDTREQKNKHILDYFDANGIKYEKRKLDSGDYSFILPNYQLLGLDEKILIEKKNSLDEISSNFTSGRERFVREFERVPRGSTIHLLVENATWTKIFHGSYRSQLNPKSFTASIITWCVRYNVPVWFCKPSESGELIYNILKYSLYEKIKNFEEMC